MGLNLSGVVWKALVGQEVNREDLEGVDVLLTRSMQEIRTIHQKRECCSWWWCAPLATSSLPLCLDAHVLGRLIALL